MKKTSRKQLRILRRRRLALALVGAMAMPMMPALAQSLPNSGEVVPGSGTATIGQSGNQMTITQTTKGAIIDWGSFNIGAGYGVTFDQQSGSSSVTLNRVIGFGYSTSASQIDGTLSANGHVFIINPAGITFGNDAQVNVGGLVASTIDMLDSDFNDGVNTNRFIFRGTSGTGRVQNDGTITATKVGTQAGRVAFVGTDLYNSGTIDAAGGSVVFGAASSVTLDFQGDGLTQVTVNGLAASTIIATAQNYGDITADGGQILMRALANPAGQGGVINGGMLRARTLISRAGRIELTAAGGSVLLGDMRDGYLGGGFIDVAGNGAGLNGGSVLIDARAVTVMSDPGDASDPSWINASGTAGGTVDIFASGDVSLYPATRINADGENGAGGQVRIAAAGNLLAQGDISAASKTGDGGSVGLVSTGANLFVTGTVSASGGGNGGSVSMLASNGGLGIDGFVSANGGTGNGGQIAGTAQTVVLAEDSEVWANGGMAGGLVGFRGTNALAAYGLLSAHGGTAGGSILTTTDGTFDIRGLWVDAGADNGPAGSWLLSAPSLDVVNGADAGSVAAPVLGSEVQDAEINYAFLTGTSVVLRSAGGVYFDGAQIVADNASPLSLVVDAEGEIDGNAFSITALDGALDMVFNSNASGLNPGFSGIAFRNATLDSNGGDIAMHGQSDPLNGTASGYDSGIELADTTIDTGGGSLSLRGSSTGGDPGVDAAGVLLDATDINTGGGTIDIYGLGAGDTSGVVALDSRLDSGGGDIAIEGEGGAHDGVRLENTGASSNGGNLSVNGIGGAYGVYVSYYAGLQSGGGDIGVHGEGGSAAGVYVFGGIGSGGGDIDVYAYSAAAEGLVFEGGFSDGISSAGGDIRLEGHGVTGGALLVGSGYGANSIDSGGGLVTIIGSASAGDALGVLLSNLAVLGGSGDVRIDGVSPAGIGILFEDGASVSTTTGAIALYGTGADFGLDIADGALDTDSGDITLEGTATAADAVAGVRVTGPGLLTDGGDITITGTSAGGVGVQLGDGGAFAIGSGGGAISIDGTGVAAGVLMDGNQVASGGGAVSIAGSGSDLGVSLDGSDIDSAGGDITVTGTASANGGTGINLDGARLRSASGNVQVLGSAVAGAGVQFGTASDIATTTGDILITGIGADVGLAIEGGEFITDSGHVDLRGRGTSATSDGLVIGNGVTIATNGGGIELSGEGGSGAGLSLGTGSFVDAGDSLVVLRAANDGSSDAIRLQGAISSGVGVNLRPGGVDANGGLTDRVDDRILLGGSTGFALGNAELALIDTPELTIGSNLHAGAIQVLGAVSRNGNLTLQNNGGAGGIDIQAALNVGNYTLGLSSGGSITQTSAGVITAHSLLAQASGNVLLATALNDVANTTLAGSAGGDFEFQDANTLAIGSVSAIGFDASSGQLSSFASTGITAGGDAFVRNLQGDLTLNAGVTATNIDLVTAGRLQNVAGASLVASGDWRVWASTWDGETRGGLAGDGNLPNLYGCAYLGACGVTVPGVDNHFIYVQQPIALITFDNATREYGLANPTFTFSVTGAILGDTAANVASGSATTTATIGSDVGNYAITGNFLSAAGYRIQFVPGTLAITPATLLFTADGAIRYLGFPNPDFTGTVTGFRNGDTIASVFGDALIWSSPAGPLSPIGYYPVIGGTSARNYVFAQAPGNVAALQIIPLPQLPSTPIEYIRETVNTYVYDRNFGGAPVCAVNASIDDTELASSGDRLSTEWSKVRSRPNLTNCFDSDRENGCGNF